MFEQNNVGVQMKTHLAEYIEGLVAGAVTADSSTFAFVADATTQILDNIDGTMRSDRTILKHNLA